MAGWYEMDGVSFRIEVISNGLLLHGLECGTKYFRTKKALIREITKYIEGQIVCRT